MADLSHVWKARCPTHEAISDTYKNLFHVFPQPPLVGIWGKGLTSAHTRASRVI